MTLLINIIIIYLIINQYFFFKKVFSKLYNDSNLVFSNFKLEFMSKKMIYSIFVLVMFFFVYIWFFKLLRLFRNSMYIDLGLVNKSLIDYDINYKVIIFGLLFLFLVFRNLRNCLIFELKFSFFSIHYFLLAHINYTFVYNLLFLFRIIFFRFLKLLGFKKRCHNVNIIILIVYTFCKYIGLVLLFFFFIFDIIKHEFVLVYFSDFLPWFSIYNTIFQIYDFFNSKVNLTNEDWAYNTIYAQELYFQILKQKHNKLPLEIQQKLPYEIYRALTHDDLEYPEVEPMMVEIVNFYLKRLFNRTEF